MHDYMIRFKKELPIPMSNPRNLSWRYSWQSAHCSQQQWTKQSGVGDSSRLYFPRNFERVKYEYRPGKQVNTSSEYTNWFIV